MDKPGRTETRELLSDDHKQVSEVLQQLLTALANKDVQSSFATLDLLWARLAVHIRAEHLHLFPAVLSRLTETANDHAASELNQAESMIEQLRTDHDFFMRELANAVGILREIPRPVTDASSETKLAAIGNTVRDIEKRLLTHNEIEENHIYRAANLILSEPEQLELATRIKAELENRPRRFPAEAWANFR
jgi:hypothetical protein